MTARQLEYAEYRKGPHWAWLRRIVLARDGYQCVHCGSREQIEPHHKVYRRAFDESLPEDLECLCRECHKLEHENKAKGQRKKEKVPATIVTMWCQQMRRALEKV